MGSRRGSLALAVVVLCGCGDNVHPGGGTLLVTPQLDLFTSEAGGTATFTVALTNQPQDNVTVELSSMDTAEGTVAPATLTFGKHDYDRPRTVTITGVDDEYADGDRPYTVRVEAKWLGAVDLDVTNQDDDSAGVFVSPLAGLMTSETGMTAAFEVQLTARPSADVTLPIASSDPTEGMPDVSSLMFGEDDWDVAQTVTVFGQPDAIADGSVAYTIMLGAAESSDAAYQGLDPDDVSLVNVDNNAPGITVSAPAMLVTSEAGAQAAFSVVLQTQPTADVTIPLASTEVGEAAVSASQLVFTQATWDQPQMVTVTGVDDFVDDGDRMFTVTLGAAQSSDVAYDGFELDDLDGVNTDDDTVGITVTPTSTLATSEAGGADSFTVVLDSQPTAAVTLAVASTDASEAAVSSAQLVFTPANWNQPHTVTVTGVDDVVDDGDQPFSVTIGAAASGDAMYAGIDPNDLDGVNTDDDTAAIVVTPTSGLVTSEIGGSDTFTVVLGSQPSGNVTIAVTSSDLSEGTPSPASLTFTPATWNQPRTVTVTGRNDPAPDGNQLYSILLAPAVSTDPLYAGMNPPDVEVTNLDNDTTSVTVDPTSGLVVSEFGDTATFSIVLDTHPTAPVTITLTSSDPSEGIVSPASVTFTPGTWDTPRTITVTGIDDATADGNQPFTIITGAAISADSHYNGLAVPDVAVTNVDNDSPSVYVQASEPLRVSENGQSATFRVRLTVAPTATVTCTLASSDPSEALLSPPTLTFSPASFGFRTVTVTGVDDQLDDGDVTFAIVLAACTSSDPAYDGFDPRDVTVVNRDND
jgi:hypothetical protein